MKRINSKSQQEWASKRGVYYPLSIHDEMLWHKEQFIQQRFNYMNEQLNQIEKTREVIDPDVQTIIKCWADFFYEDIKCSEYDVHKMNDIIKEYTSTIEDAAKQGIDGNIKIDFSYKKADKNNITQIFECNAEIIEHTLINASCYKRTGQVFLNENDAINIIVYIGDVSVHKRGFMQFLYKGFGEKCYIEIDDFCMLSKNINNEFIFTVFNRRENIVFVKLLESLENIDLFTDDEDDDSYDE